MRLRGRGTSPSRAGRLFFSLLVHKTRSLLDSILTSGGSQNTNGPPPLITYLIRWLGAKSHVNLWNAGSVPLGVPRALPVLIGLLVAHGDSGFHGAARTYHSPSLFVHIDTGQPGGRLYQCPLNLMRLQARARFYHLCRD